MAIAGVTAALLNRSLNIKDSNLGVFFQLKIKYILFTNKKCTSLFFGFY